MTSERSSAPISGHLGECLARLAGGDGRGKRQQADKKTLSAAATTLSKAKRRTTSKGSAERRPGMGANCEKRGAKNGHHLVVLRIVIIRYITKCFDIVHSKVHHLGSSHRRIELISKMQLNYFCL